VHLSKGRVLVTAGPRIVEIAGPERVRQLLAAPNAVAVRKRKTGAIVAIQLLDFGDNLRLPSRYGNPQRSRPYAEIRVKCGHIARNLLNKRALLSCIFMHYDVNLLILNEHILAAFLAGFPRAQRPR
jgi:hypothetical protein